MRKNRMADYAKVRNITSNSNTTENCQILLKNYTVGNDSGKTIGLVLAFVLSHLLHHLLKPHSQARIASDIAVGLVIGNMPWIRDSFDGKFVTTINFVVEFGMICYMFVLGLEMDPWVLLRAPTQAAMVTYGAMASTFVLACATTPFLGYTNKPHIGFTLSLSITLSGSGSHVLTRIITNLKIGKSDIGKLVVAAAVHADMISMLLVSIGFIFVPLPHDDDGTVSAYAAKVIPMGTAWILQMVLAAKISPIFMNWVNNENPDGKPMKGSHLVLSIAFMVVLCGASPVYEYSPILSAFMTGIFLPREGRLTKWTVGKINYLLTTIFYPVFFLWMGYHASFRKFEYTSYATWVRFLSLVVVTIAGKVVGSVICGAMLGFHWRESVELGLLLSAKGHFHIFLATLASIMKVTSTTNSIIGTAVVFITVVHAPSVVLQIISRARELAPTHRRALQWLDPSNELRALICLHGPHNIASTINFMEISRGSGDPGILAYATDVVELTDSIAATVVQNKEVDTVTVTDREVTSMRDQITSAIQAYLARSGGKGITLKRMLTLSSFNDMAQDICNLAEDLMVSLIVLPFHKKLSENGTLDNAHLGFRYANRKVLRNAPCSVGILVDRGIGLVENISSMARSLQVAVIFIGGGDDREALAYAGCAAQHPGVKLTVIRLLLDDNSENAKRRTGNYRTNRDEEDEEMKLDDECFAQFYGKHISGGHVTYMEKHQANSAETYATLRSMEGQFALVIVGRGGRVNSALTVGMGDWQQCPELGPVGDVLSGSDLTLTTSILILQQHCPKGELDGVDDEFSVM